MPRFLACYTCHCVWFNHVGLALKHGIAPEAVEAIKNKREPVLVKDDEKSAYAFATEVLRDNAVSDATLV